MTTTREPQSVAELMTRDPIVVGVATPLADAAELMDFYRVSGLPVVDESGRRARGRGWCRRRCRRASPRGDTHEVVAPPRTLHERRDQDVELAAYRHAELSPFGPVLRGELVQQMLVGLS